MEKQGDQSKAAKMRTFEVKAEYSRLPDLDKEAKSKIHGFLSNRISTTKFTLWTFFPKALMYQFARFANIYFLVTAVIQSIPYVSPLNPFSAILPLLFVLGVSMVREGAEDYSRYRMDCQINESKCTIYKDGKWVEVQWSQVYVGDYIQIKSEERFPADIMILSTSHKKENKGAAFIETASLDGERNLKPKNAIPEIMAQIDEKGLESFTGSVTLET